MSKLRGAVSIVGVGCTRFGDAMDTPGLAGLTLQEIGALAAEEALADAGMAPWDVDAIIIGNVMVQTSQLPSTYSQLSRWIGTQYASGVHIDAACSTTNVGAQLAAMGLASTAWNRVLVVGLEITRSKPSALSPWERERLSSDETWLWTDMCVDQAYTVPGGYDIFTTYNGILAQAYMRKFGVSMQDYDRAMFEVCRGRRALGAKNERAFQQETLEDEATRLGLGSAWELWSSRYNPFIAWPSRFRSVVTPADGASAMVLTRSEDAHNYHEHPVQILGFGTSQADLPWYGADPTDWKIDRLALQRAYEMAGITGADLDYIHTHDCSHIMGAIMAERAGYIPEGQFLKYAMDGRLGPDGDKPMTTHGGRHAFGHAWAASAGSDTYEVVKQMRGLAGERQMPSPPETALIQTHGYAMISNALILRGT